MITFLVLEVSHAHNWSLRYTKKLTIDKLLAYHLFIRRDRQSGLTMGIPSTPQKPEKKGPQTSYENIGGDMVRKKVSFSVNDLFDNPNLINEIEKSTTNE